jgi:DNA polymerase III sliding clamp (beta) subunit (PCNA family)
MSTVLSEDLALAASALRGAVEEDTFRIRSASSKSFLEASSGGLRVRKVFSMRGKHWDRTLPFQAFLKMIKLFQGRIEVELRGEDLIFSDGRRQLSLQSSSATDWVPSPDWSEPQEITTLAADLFRNSLRQASRAVSQDAGRPLLQAVALAQHENELVLVSTDSFRFLYLPLEGKPVNALPRPLLLPGSAARALVADLQRAQPEEVWIEFAEEGESSGGIISYGKTSWYLRSPDGHYPEWEELLETSGPELKLPREDLDQLLRFVEALQGKARPEQNGAAALHLQLGPEVSLYFRKPGLGEIKENLQGVSWPGREETLGLNPLFLRDMVEVLEGQDLRAQKSSSGGFLFSGRGRSRYLLMPIRLPEEL